LSLGACLGGNGTIIGASANVIVSGIAAREGHPITFIGFMKIAFPLMLISVAIAMVYLLLFFV
jgi:Na+/H+ antiporter NhaD/arsenite permease-like protein